MATDVKQEQVLKEAIGEINHIATLPEITLKIIELVEDPSSTAQDLHKLISIDPALCSRVLKVVNSSFYGLPGQIAAINRAIVMLGLNAVKNIAIAASLAKLFRGGQITPYFAARDLWDHSIGTAAATKLLAEKLGFDRIADELVRLGASEVAPAGLGGLARRVSPIAALVAAAIAPAALDRILLDMNDSLERKPAYSDAAVE